MASVVKGSPVVAHCMENVSAVEVRCEALGRCVCTVDAQLMMPGVWARVLSPFCFHSLDGKVGDTDVTSAFPWDGMR